MKTRTTAGCPWWCVAAVGVLSLGLCPPTARAQRAEGARPADDAPERARAEIKVLESHLRARQVEIKLDRARLDMAYGIDENARKLARARMASAMTTSLSEIDLLNQEAQIAWKQAEIDETAER